MDAVLSKPLFVFADFRLDPERRLLLHDGELVTLHPKAFDLLLFLIENHDRVLSKEELLNKVWAEQFVEENNLAVQISTLRKIFGEKKNEHRFIVTVPNKGYRFVAEVGEERRELNNFHSENPSNTDTETSFSDRIKTGEEKKKSANKYWLPLGISVILFVAVVSIYQLVRPNSDFKELKLNKLTTSGKITNAALTRDGKFAILAQKETGGESLWLKQMETGTQTRIAAPQAVEYVGLSVSPDDKYIYFSIFLDNSSGGWLRRMPLIGGAVQEIAGIDSGVSIAFSPDGKRFAYTESSSSIRQTRLMIADADGANSKILLRAEDGKRKFPAYKASPAAWSPDGGNEIACAVLEKNADGVKAGILLVNAETGSEKFLLAPRFAWIDNVVWTDAENIAFVASENDEWSSQIWSVSKATGETKKITNDLQKYFWLAAANNSLLTVQENSVSSLHIADFDENAKELQPREILKEADIDYAAFGANNSIYYVSRSSGKRDLWRVEKNGTNPLQLTTGANISYGFAVAPNDDSIIFSSARSGRNSLWTADASGGNFRRLTDGDDIAPQISADGKRIVFQRGLYDFPTVWTLSFSENAPVQLVGKHSLKPAISPDGSQAAFYFMDDGGAWGVGLVSTVTGAFRRKLNFPTTVNERRMRWHPAGKFLTLIFSAGENLNLMLLPVDGGEPKIIGGLGRGELDSFDWSPDGKQIIFSKSDRSTDAVLLDGF